MKVLLENDLVDKKGDGLVCVSQNDDVDFDMVDIFVKYRSYSELELVVDRVICKQKVDFAKYLFEKHKIKPTSRVYRYLLWGREGDEWSIDTLNWLYDDMGCTLKPWNTSNLSCHKFSAEVRQWFNDHFT